MTKIKVPKPDYKFWATKETWSLNESALLLHGIDPLQNRSVQLREKDTPAEFKQAQKTYILLQSIPWRTRYPEKHIPGFGIHPGPVVLEAEKKGLPIPARLLTLVDLRCNKESEEEVEEQYAIPITLQDANNGECRI